MPQAIARRYLRLSSPDHPRCTRPVKRARRAREAQRGHRAHVDHGKTTWSTRCCAFRRFGGRLRVDRIMNSGDLERERASRSSTSTAMRGTGDGERRRHPATPLPGEVSAGCPWGRRPVWWTRARGAAQTRFVLRKTWRRLPVCGSEQDDRPEPASPQWWTRAELAGADDELERTSTHAQLLDLPA